VLCGVNSRADVVMFKSKPLIKDQLSWHITVGHLNMEYYSDQFKEYYNKGYRYAYNIHNNKCIGSGLVINNRVLPVGVFKIL